MSIFTGAGVAIITPMTETGAVNYPKLEEILEYQIANGVRNLCKMCNQTLLSRFIVVRSYQENAVHTVFFCFLRKIDSGLCTIRTGTCDNRDSSGNLLCRKPDCFQMLLMAQGR